MAHFNLDEIPEVGTDRAKEIVALDDALNALSEMDPRKVAVIEMRFLEGSAWKRPARY